MSLDINFIRSFGRLDLLAKKAIEGFMTGIHKSPYQGYSVEFAEHKQYNFGESTKHIDWKVYGKTDRLYVKKYEEETNLKCHIYLDFSSSMFYPKENDGKVMYSSYAAAALCYLLSKQRDAFGLTLFDEEIIKETPVKNTLSHFNQLVAILEEKLKTNPVNKKTDLIGALNRLASRKVQRNLVVVFTDFLSNKDELDEIMETFHHLRHNKHELLVFHVYDKQLEEEFDFGNTSYLITDVETGESLKTNPKEIREAYQKKTKTYFNEVELNCKKYKIDFIKADIHQPLDQVLTPFLKARVKLR
ncbi:MAG: DUF58 domain-containing protein [Cyclobacteriaceae bacterium]